MTPAVLCSRQNLFGSRRYTVLVRKISDKGMKLSSDDRTSRSKGPDVPSFVAMPRA